MKCKIKLLFPLFINVPWNTIENNTFAYFILEYLTYTDTKINTSTLTVLDLFTRSPIPPSSTTNPAPSSYKCTCTHIHSHKTEKNTLQWYHKTRYIIHNWSEWGETIVWYSCVLLFSTVNLHCCIFFKASIQNVSCCSSQSAWTQLGFFFSERKI